MADPRIEIYTMTGPDGQQFHARLLNKNGVEIHQNLIEPKENVNVATEAVRCLRETFLDTKFTYSPSGSVVDTF